MLTPIEFISKTSFLFNLNKSLQLKCYNYIGILKLKYKKVGCIL